MSAYDSIVVGAGPAGLTAAVYLSRYRRRVLVLDGGPSRARWIPESHNTPGFPQGVGGDALLQRLRAQATGFGAEIRQGLVADLAIEEEVFQVIGVEGALTARAVLLATGVVDRLPPIEGIEDAIRDSRVRMCPICDAFEAIDKRIAVLGDGPVATREVAFLRTYSDDVTLLTLDAAGAFLRSQHALPISIRELSLTPSGLMLTQTGRPDRQFDYLYLALGCAPQSMLATRCGAREDETGNLLVNAHQMTSVPGLYAAGDVVRGLNQIAVATGEAAVAATDIHNRLRRAETGRRGKDGVSR